MAEWFLGACASPSLDHRARARARQDVLTKPAGSLGRLEDVAITLSGLQGRDRPSADRARIVIFAGDHGVTVHGVSAFPSSVTVEMLRNFANGGAAIAVLARSLGASLTVIDAGTLADAPVPGVVTDKPCFGTRDFTAQAAMTDAEVAFALGCGRRAVTAATSAGADVLIFGEMGIGNTTAAAALACALLDRRPEDLVGDGTGVDGAGRARKVDVIARALGRHGLREGNALRALTAIGGLEIAALTGAIIAAAQRGTAVLVDGFIVTVAALTAIRINPGCAPWLIYGHSSAERGHKVVLEALAARPLLDLGLRLGEASGAAAALPLLRLACALHNGMATFAEAAVSGRSAW